MSMRNKVCLITGANSGIGLATAKILAHQGATIIMICRHEQRGRWAQAEIKAYANHDRVELFLANLSSKEQIQNATNQFKEKHQKLDVLINNAGLQLPKRYVTQEGWEMMFAINHLGYFMTACLLADVLKQTPQARIINVASIGHWMGTIDFENLQCEQNFNSLRQYCNTKLANILFTRVLAKRTKSFGITTNCLHPGIFNSGFGQDEKSWFATVMKLGAPFLQSPQKGAKTTIFLASNKSIGALNGKYFARSKPACCSRASKNMEKAQKLWDKSVEMTGLDWC